MLKPTLSTALKEWNVVCQALGSGQQIILLRKGGILESSTGFEVEHEQFLLYPTFVHQNPEMLKPEFQKGIEQYSSEPSKITLSALGQVTDIIRLKYRQQMDALYSEHLWTAPLIEMRFNYKPQNPLYLLIVRGYRLEKPVVIDNTPEYAGCKSWVPLEHAIEIGGASPALGDREYEARRSRITGILSAG